MKKLILIAIAALIAGVPHVTSATTYLDSVSGEGGLVGTGGGILDISSVEVTSGATTLSFKINLQGDPVATDWGKYMISIDSVPGGDSVGNGWSRPIGMPGMDFWLGTWVDSGNGAEVRNWGGASWGLQSATYGANPDAISVSKNSSSVTVLVNFAGLGLAPGSSFFFDVFTSGGNTPDGAIDALGNPGQTIANWGDPYNSGSLVNSFTIPAVPEPSSAVLVLCAGGLLAVFRRKI
jgi:hypothetical protein